jgi:NhaP-type Na+/H+ or K+/H+ antiporter
MHDAHVSTFTLWCLLCGALLIAVGLSDTWRQNLPFSTSAIYLLAGWLLGPEALGLLTLRLDADARWIEHLAEAAVLVSLFAVGLRLHVGPKDPIWRAPLLFATFAMLVTIGLMWVFGLAVGLTSGAALLLAAVLAPTDPVLASDVQVRDVQDRDRLRFSLTAEGGLNDGAAFPFVMLALGLLGLHELGTLGLRWWGVDLLWATMAGLATGWCLGIGFSRAVVFLRREREQALGMESFLTLGLIAISYGVATAIHAYGFLAVFAAGLAMRHVERRDRPRRGEVRAPTPEAAADARQSSAYMAQAVLDFTLDLERLAELIVMVVIGSLITRAAFSPEAVLAALFLMLVVRPVAIGLATLRVGWTRRQRLLAAWFGIRGIGSLYYLAYASAHGAIAVSNPLVADAVLVSIVLSVLLHGASATPLMNLYRRSRARRS